MSTTDKIEHAQLVIANRRLYIAALAEEERRAGDAIEALTTADMNGERTDSKELEKLERLLAGLPHRKAAAEKAIRQAEAELAKAQDEARRAEGDRLAKELADVSQVATVLALRQAHVRREDRDLGLLLYRLKEDFDRGQLRLRELAYDGKPGSWPLAMGPDDPYAPLWTRPASPELVAERLTKMLGGGMPKHLQQLATEIPPDTLQDLDKMNGALSPGVHQAVKDVEAAITRGLAVEGAVSSKKNGR